MEKAVEWALRELHDREITNADLVDKVREYLNNHNIPYDTFSYDDLVPYLPQ